MNIHNSIQKIRIKRELQKERTARIKSFVALAVVLLLGIFIGNLFTQNTNFSITGYATGALPTVGGDSGNWGTVLNNYLSQEHTEEGAHKNVTVSGSLNVSGIIRSDNWTNVSITESQISGFGNYRTLDNLTFVGDGNFTGNLSIGDKITFRLGEIIDNLIDGWIQVTGSLNVSNDINVVGNLKVDNIIDVAGTGPVNIIMRLNSAQQVGNDLVITGTGIPTLATLSSSRIAFIDSDNDDLRTYDFDGTNWVQIGNNLSVAGISIPALTALSPTRVAFIDQLNKDLRTYDFNGSDWSQIGNNLSVASANNPALTALSSTRVAFIGDINDDLRVYDFDGTDWTQIGNNLNIAGAINPALTALSSTRVAFIDSGNDHLRTYQWTVDTNLPPSPAFS